LLICRIAFHDQEDSGLYLWPDLSLDSERWRYDTIEPCQEAINKPASAIAKQTEIKKAFEGMLNKTREELYEMLRKVGKLDHAALEDWAQTPKKVADMWLLMGTQRCRLVMVIPSGELVSQADRAEKARNDGLELVIKPEVVRYGNARGQDLTKKGILVKGESAFVRDV
jgi:hypothetical protein